RSSGSFVLLYERYGLTLRVSRFEPQEGDGEVMAREGKRPVKQRKSLPRKRHARRKRAAGVPNTAWLDAAYNAGKKTPKSFRISELHHAWNEFLHTIPRGRIP